MKKEDKEELRDFYCEDKYPNIYGVDVTNVD
jgi:hypothetical protein